MESVQYNKKIQSQLLEPDEYIMVCEPIKKLKAIGPPDHQERLYIMTTDRIYTFKSQLKSRLYKIKDVSAILLSNQNTNDFMIFFERSDDLVISTPKRKEILDLLKLRFNCLNRNITLRVYGVTNQQLIMYHRTNNEQNKKAYIYDLPDDTQRLHDQEIQGEEEYIEELKRKKSRSEDHWPFDYELGIETEFISNSKNDQVKKEELREEPDFQDMRESILVGKREVESVTLQDFSLKMIIGRGTFGKVYLAERMEKLYAIKAIRKDTLIEYNQVQNTQLEKDILMSCDHQFLVGMEYLFQSTTRLYFVMPFVKGGELYKIFKVQKRFSEEVVKFYSAQICLAIGYLHSKGIMHRDLKLENILVDESGYLKIIDYGLAKILSGNEVATTFCGTPEYLAPEMIDHKGHDFCVDWWALGILIYEMVIGVSPFYNRERKVLLMKIRQQNVKFPNKTKYKIDYSDDFVDLVLKLLNKDKDQRLGAINGSDEILQHPFFASLNIKDLLNYKIEAPIKFDKKETEGGSIDTRFFNSKSAPQDLTETLLPPEHISMLKNHDDHFKNFETTKRI